MMKESIHQKDLIISNVYTPKKKKKPQKYTK